MNAQVSVKWNWEELATLAIVNEGIKLKESTFDGLLDSKHSKQFE